MEKIKAPCPYCKGEKNCHIIGHKKENGVRMMGATIFGLKVNTNY